MCVITFSCCRLRLLLVWPCLGVHVGAPCAVVVCPGAHHPRLRQCRCALEWGGGGGGNGGKFKDGFKGWGGGRPTPRGPPPPRGAGGLGRPPAGGRRPPCRPRAARGSGGGSLGGGGGGGGGRQPDAYVCCVSGGVSKTCRKPPGRRCHMRSTGWPCGPTINNITPWQPLQPFALACMHSNNAQQCK
jgi:hypothetical protein